MLPTFLASYEEGLVLYRQWQLLNDILKQWIPLNLLAVLARTLDAYQTQSNRVLLSTFNERIAKEILWQPSPYIYERLGRIIAITFSMNFKIHLPYSGII